MEQVTTKLHDRRLYVGDYLISPDQRIENGAVLCEDEQILAVGGFSGFSDFHKKHICSPFAHNFRCGYLWIM